jgi:hypothetical protein
MILGILKKMPFFFGGTKGEWGEGKKRRVVGERGESYIYI